LLVAAIGAVVAAAFLSRAYDRERQAKLAAAGQRDRAQRNLARARQAVDRFLTRVGDQRLLDTPQAEPLRQALLRDALALHQQFEQEEGDDPEVRHEAAMARERLGQLYWRLGQATEAEKAYRDTIAALEPLTAEFPGGREYLRDLSSTYNLL